MIARPQVGHSPDRHRTRAPAVQRWTVRFLWRNLHPLMEGKSMNVITKRVTPFITPLLITLAVGIILGASLVTAGSAHADSGIGTAIARAAKCHSDEGENQNAPCFWDARHQGNGKGRSFKAKANGEIRFVSHARAHCMIRTHEVGSCPGGGH